MKEKYWRDEVKNPKVLKLLDDLTDRRGLSNAWDEIDFDIQCEIIKTWEKIVTPYQGEESK